MNATATSTVDTVPASGRPGLLATLRVHIARLPRPVRLALFVTALPAYAALAVLGVSIVAALIASVLLIAIVAFLYLFFLAPWPTPASVAASAALLVAGWVSSWI